MLPRKIPGFPAVLFVRFFRLSEKISPFDGWFVPGGFGCWLKIPLRSPLAGFSRTFPGVRCCGRGGGF
nr:MAG TPA: hypothetical protein [Caudoviricetes sp.]